MEQHITATKGNKPDYTVRAMNKNTGAKGTIGVAWTKDNGRISIALNPFIEIPTGPDIIISLFPTRPNQENLFQETTNALDDEIPF